MSEQVKQQPAKKVKAQEEVASTKVADKHQKLKDDLDAIIDFVDETLNEHEAASWVAAFVQKGGQ